MRTWTWVALGGMALLLNDGVVAQDARPTVRVEQEKLGDKVLTLARIAVPTIPQFECDVWCYEDALGQGQGSPQPDGSMILRHKHPKGAEVETRLVPSAGAVDWFVTVTGPTPDAVRAINSVNGCWQFRRAPGFQSLKDQFVESFVNQCFVYTVRGITFFKDTLRFPDTRRPATDKTNSPPWVQQYLPVWQRHPGQPAAFWGISADRPIYSLIGIASRDRKYLAAWGCRRSNNLSQGWHDCLHLGPNMRPDYDERQNRTVSHFKMYFVDFDPVKLLDAYKRDFPSGQRLEARPGKDNATLEIASPGLAGNVVTLRLGDGIPWTVTPWDTCEKKGPAIAYWAHPEEDFLDIFVSAHNRGGVAAEPKIASSLVLSDAPAFLGRTKPGECMASSPDGAWTLGMVWERSAGLSADRDGIGAQGTVPGIPRGEQRTLRARVLLVRGNQGALEARRQAVLDEWEKAPPFRLPPEEQSRP